MRYIKGIIVKAIDGFYYVLDENKNEYICKSRKKFRFDNLKPQVGDNVEINIINENSKEGVIEKIFDRISCLIRPSLSNLTQVFIVFSYIEPKINFETLNKLLVNFEASNIDVILIINKEDLYTKEDKEELNRIFLNFYYRIIYISIKHNKNIDKVKEKLKNNISCFCGPSGVGKSSLLNSIVGEDIMDVSLLSDKVKRGKHTTRFSQLIYLEDIDGYIIDTPGFTSVDIYKEITMDRLKKYFIEFEEYNDCKFRECNHINEVECNVKKAVCELKINKMRYDHYVRFYNQFKNKGKFK